MMANEGGDVNDAEKTPKEAIVGTMEGEKGEADVVNIEVAKDGTKQESEASKAPEDKEDGTDREEVKEEEGTDGAITEGALKKKRTVRKFIKKETLEGEHLEGEQGEEQGEWVLEELSEESLQGEDITDREPSLMDEGMEGEGTDEDERGQYSEEPLPEEEEKQPEKAAAEEELEEEYIFIEEVIDPAAPYNFTDSDEALKKPFELKQDQLAEVEQLWELFQDHTPAYSNIDGFITVKELIYMLKSINLMPYTEDQMQELIDFCVRPPHPKGHINFDQFVKIVTLRKRDFPQEEELRACLQFMDPEKTGMVDRAYLKEVIGTLGYKMPPRMLENLIKEVDMANDGTIGIEDVVGTIMMDLNRDDINMLMTLIYPDEEPVFGEGEEGDLVQ